jgi:HAD superfamily hydrolase (TIGR01509 family)
MLRAVIFDFNGIIVDDEPVHFELFQRVLGEEGIALTEEDYYDRYLGFDDRGAFLAAFRDHGQRLDDGKLGALIQRKAGYYQEAITTKMRVFPGVKKLVPALAQHFPLAIASGALRHEIDRILAAIDLSAYFCAIVSAEDVNEGKPEPDIFLKAVAKLNAQLGTSPPIEARDCLVIEDSKEGVRGARRAGMNCLAVTNSHPAELLAEATAVVKSLKEVSVAFLQSLCP